MFLRPINDVSSPCLFVRDGCCHFTIPASDINRLIARLNEEGLEHQLNILWSLFVILDQAERERPRGMNVESNDQPWTDLTTYEQMSGIRLRTIDEEVVEVQPQ